MNCAERLAIEKEHCRSLDKRIDLLDRAIGSFQWLDNNKHQYGTSLWLEFFDAAMEDAKVAAPYLFTTT